MVETLEKQFCGACGVDIRPKALFCYNCGSQVASDKEVELENEHQKKISDAWFKEELTENKTVENTATAAKLQKNEPLSEKPSSVKPTTTENKKGEKVEAAAELQTAASLKNKPKPAIKKTVEVVWEEPQSAPNLWFLIVSLLLIGFAVFVLFAMLYIR
jgi:hypothetical protein